MNTSFHNWQKPISQDVNSDSNYSLVMAVDYYERVFTLLHAERTRTIPDIVSPHSIRRRYWQLVPQGKYSGEKARDILFGYYAAVDAELSKYIGALSLSYCIHLYRRLFPGPIGENNEPVTIGLTRAILEAAFQKYAIFALCDKVAFSATVPISRVLSGLLMAPEFAPEREIVAQGNQLVLTDFSSVDLDAFYDLEKLAYEIWRISCAQRIIGKGASLLVRDFPICFADDRSDGLDFLVTNYDQRSRKGNFSVSAKGVVFPDEDSLSKDGYALLPLYNIGGITDSEFKSLFSRLYRIRVPDEHLFNFVWIPFNLRGFRNAHIFYAETFQKKYGVSLDAVLTVIAALADRVFISWSQTQGLSIFRYWQRAYEGPYVKQFVRDALVAFLPEACMTLDIKPESINIIDIDAAIKYWELDSSNRADIDLGYSGPHYIFLPCGHDRVFIDYAWILRRLHDLFFDVSIPDQNFKGDALEALIRSDKSVLPVKPCRCGSGEERQIDYALVRGPNLIIVECKAVGRSIGFERGDTKAIEYRNLNVVDRALSEIDDKAAWLADHPIGTNYNISAYDYIIPLAVSPFVEFIPSRDIRYWLSNDSPRVLTPDELASFLKDTSLIANALNKVALRLSS